MSTRVHLVSAIVVLGLALAHTGYTAVAFGSWSPGAVWFAGTGLGLLLLSALNLAARRAVPVPGPVARLAVVANAVGLLFGLGAVLAVPEPQAFVVLAGLAGLALSAPRALSARSPRTDGPVL